MPNAPLTTMMHLADIIAQPRALEALQLVLASPYPSSLLISGGSGTGKSTLLSAIRQLPWERSVLSLPATLAIEELTEHIDIEQTLRRGQLVQLPHLLQRMQGAVVLIDNAQIMQPEVLTRLLDLQAASSVGAPICLIAAVNTQDGSLRSTLLDRFDLYVEMSRLQDPLSRVQILRQAIHREGVGHTQVDTDMVARLLDYRARCTQVVPTESDMALACELCRRAFLLGHRADIALLHAASVHAAIEERTGLQVEDFSAVKDFVLAHRLNNTQPLANNPPAPDDPQRDPSLESTPEEAPRSRGTSASSSPVEHPPYDDEPADPQPGLRSGIIPEQREDIASLRLHLDPISQLARHSRSALGLGSRLKSLASRPRGHYYKATAQHLGEDYRVALLATIREAIPYQQQRKQAKTSDLAILISASDLRYKLCRRRTGYHILFAVDASGSMGAKRRMHRVKGLIIELLRRAYEERDYVGLLTFRGDVAELQLPLTKSIARAHSLLGRLETGGRTPLFLGLSRSLEVLKHAWRRNRGITPLLVVVTDGRATSRYAGENSLETLGRLGVELRQIGAKILVIDSEEGFVRMGKAQQLAEILGAEACYPMEEIIEHREHIYRRENSF